MRDPARSINNDLYNAEGDIWWQPNCPLFLMRSSVNPARIGYFKEILFRRIDPTGKKALEVGCGGGLLCEEIAKLGFEVTGIDPSSNSLNAAAGHAKTSGLDIRYRNGVGESLPFPDRSFDAVFCCDVLEHVRDVPTVISEISRVLKPGGCFLYDTLNRTFLSKLVAIKIAQDWKRWAFAPPEIHNWKMFIRPEELSELLEKNRLEWIENTGMQMNVTFPELLACLRRRVKGVITYQGLGEQIVLVQGGNTDIMYMGYAIKMGSV
ncbi:Ubiquinone biosynthesis O-methyltransferase [bioreactor metagenome]|uniref:Ubiquinone biosynthesis O-methyltransferase n=1 Tax=bioreactor metagenome TaxID=1076179 RepID=A0A644X531_9ZZZZ